MFVDTFRHTQKGEELMKAQQAKKAAQSAVQTLPLSVTSDADVTDTMDDGQPGTEWPYDPNEPRYCLCNQVSYGEMVGCDNKDVSAYPMMFY